MESLGEPGDWQVVGEGRAHAVFAHKGAVPHADSCLVRTTQKHGHEQSTHVEPLVALL